MLQAYIDGSSTHKGDILVLAGWIAPSEAWEQFSEEWKAFLDARPLSHRQLDEFKFSSINFNSSKSLELAEGFYRIIEKHVIAGVSCAIFADGLSEQIDKAPWVQFVNGVENLKNPYFFAFKAIIDVLAQHQHELGIAEPIDFIFDDQTEKARCIDGWNYWKGSAQAANPEQYALLGKTPAFRNSKLVRPLQAADVHAGFVRKWYQEGNEKTCPPFLKLPWDHKQKLPIFAMGFDAIAIRENLDRIYRNERAKAVVRKVSRPWQKYGV